MLQVLLDMNVSPEWMLHFKSHGIEAIHWSHVGDIRATDSVIMAWANEHRFIVLTHNVDFSIALAISGDSGPSVLQVRSPQLLSTTVVDLVIGAISQFEVELSQGALVVVEPSRNRARILPL